MQIANFSFPKDLKGLLIKVIGLILLLISCLPVNFYAQNRPVKFEHLTVEQGLSKNIVICILQDRQGFMWFGTQDGLNKYDGYRFTVYKHNPLDSTSLSGSGVGSIYEDRSGTLWIGTDGGLNRFDREKEQFSRFVHDPNNPSSLSDNKVSSIYEDHKGTLWIGTWGGGLNKFDREKKQFSCFVNDPKNPFSLSDNRIRVIHEDSQDVLWISTWGGGLNKFDRKKEQFTHFLNDPKNPHSLSHNIVWPIYEDSKGVLWIGTWGGGLNKLVPSKGKGSDRNTEQFVYFVHDKNDPHSLNHHHPAVVENLVGIHALCPHVCRSGFRVHSIQNRNASKRIGLSAQTIGT